MDTIVYLILLLVGGAVLVHFVTRFGRELRGLWMTTSRFNSTRDWTVLERGDQEPAPLYRPLEAWCLRLLEPHLGSGERLEGFARACFSPSRPVDWGFKLGLDQTPLLVAATSRRLILFELGFRTARRSCFIRLDEIRSLRAPRVGSLGTSGPLWLQLGSGREYQLQFVGPLFDDQAMRYEQRLAAHLRAIESRYPPPQRARAA